MISLPFWSHVLSWDMMPLPVWFHVFWGESSPRGDLIAGGFWTPRGRAGLALELGIWPFGGGRGLVQRVVWHYPCGQNERHMHFLPTTSIARGRNPERVLILTVIFCRILCLSQTGALRVYAAESGMEL